MIVVDTDVVAAFWLRSPRSSVARLVRRRDPDWIVPVLWRSEFRSVLRKYLLGGHLALAQGQWYMDKAEAMLNGREYRVRSADVLKLVERSQHSSYDCEYVALAEAQAITLVTGDRKVAQLFPGTAVLMEDFV